MRILLDTHVFLWLVSGDTRLPSAVLDALTDPGNQTFLSAVSLWEATVKHQLGKLTLPAAPEAYLPASRLAHGIASLPLTETAVTRLPALPRLHRDPFDRMLICQALDESMTLATVDSAIKAYPVTTLAGL